MKKLVSILIILALSMSVLFACADDYDEAYAAWVDNFEMNYFYMMFSVFGSDPQAKGGLWRCSDGDYYCEVYHAGGEYALMKRSDSEEVILADFSEAYGVLGDGALLEWVGDDLQGTDSGHVFKKQDFPIRKPAKKSATSIDEFLGDWEIKGFNLNIEENPYNLDDSLIFPSSFMGMDFRMHVDAEGGYVKLAFPDNGKGKPAERIIQFKAPQLENGKVYMDYVNSDVKGACIDLVIYENGWIEVPYNADYINTVFLERNSASVPTSAAASTAEEAEVNEKGADDTEMSIPDTGNQAEPEEAALESRVMHTAKGGLDVKATASKSAKKLVTLKKDREVTVLGMEGDWYYIEVDLGNKKVQGYVPVDALK